MADDGSRTTYRMRKFARSNQGTCANQRPIVERVSGSRPARCWPTVPAQRTVRWRGGKNLLVAIMPWEGHNYRDAIILRSAS